MRRTDRRLSCGDPLRAALLDAGTALSFADLAAAAPECDAREISAWLGHALQARLIEDVAEPGGERRYRLRRRGAEVLGSEQRRTPTRRTSAAAST